MTVTVKPPNMPEIIKKSEKAEAEVLAFLQIVKRSMKPFQKRIAVVESGSNRFYAVERRDIGVLNTDYGKFWQFSFAIDAPAFILLRRASRVFQYLSSKS